MTTSAAHGDAPLFTVAICTWNRAESLRRALESHAAQHVPDGLRWELIVVDNASADETQGVLDAFEGRLPLRRVYESKVGLSHARNAAVAAARGTYMAWTDDDVLVDPRWLAEYAAAVHRYPDAAVLGGPIRPRFEPEAPAWLVRGLPAVGGALALLDLGPAPMPLGGEQVPFGANYVVRAAEQRRHPYSPALGRVGVGMGAGEELSVVRAVLADGAVGWWVPEATVEHVIQANRQTLAYIRGFYLGAARSVGRPAVPEPGALFGRPRWVWRQAVERELRFRIGRAIGTRPERWVRDFMLASNAWGILRAPVVDPPPVAGGGASLPDAPEEPLGDGPLQQLAPLSAGEQARGQRRRARVT